MAVTIPGGPTSTSPNITLAAGTGDILNLAQQIGALLATVQGAGNLTVTTTTGSLSSFPGPNVASPSASELLILNNTPLADTVPSGWTYVMPAGSAPVTLTGNNVALIPGSAGGSFNVTGASTVAPNGGNNTVQASGTYLLSFGPGNDSVLANGQGLIATNNQGASTVIASGTGPGNQIESYGTGDFINLLLGSNTVDAFGNNSTVSGATGSLTVDVTGTGDVILGNAANVTGTISGSQNLVYPGSGLLNLTVSGTNNTIVGSSASSTINATGNDVVFGHSTAPLNFVGGAGTSTILGGQGGTETVVGGSGGVVFSANTSNRGTLIGGTGVTTIFGGNGSFTTFNSSLAGGIMMASGGNETLNAAGSNAAATFSGGNQNGAVSMVGSSRADVFFAGNGPETITSGSGADVFSFIKANTAGAHDFITDFNASDSLFLTGYDSTATAFSTGPGGVTMTLSDNTTITFTNLTNQSQLNGHYLYVKPNA